ncbi:trypsin alpha-3-like isoform X2 [Homarus americanus]|uniref:trypsin alpha-3-like isoform X2 n=1 Tax=Homarus americanus TaxID=6706 RepID=UPI001C45B1AA|nr:trypsin alpha-3-like isoform X2 [Homarus americanus]
MTSTHLMSVLLLVSLTVALMASQKDQSTTTSELPFIASDVTIHLSEHSLNTSGETPLVVRNVSTIIIHGQYSSSTMINDIALLKLSTPLQVNATVMPVCLPPRRRKYSWKNATVTGWGTTSYGGSISDVLREVNVTVLSNKACRYLSYRSAIMQEMMCAGTKGKDACQGDSGGHSCLLTGEATMIRSVW